MELIWDGKYKDGKRVAPVKLALPFQTIETVNESAQERQRMLDFFSSSRDTEWRNRLIWGDKKYVLPSLLDEFAPVTLSDVKAIARETWRRVGTGEDAPGEAGVDILGWDFAFELHEMGSQTAKDAGIDVRFRKIPREVLEKKAVDQGDIRFFELGRADGKQQASGEEDDARAA